MDSMNRLVSPKQMARAIGVSESSLKRWCDRGLIKTVRTTGGHRRIQIGEAVSFIRAREHQFLRPELLGLPPVSAHAELGLARGKDRLAEALLDGNELLSRQIVYDLFLAKHSLSVICDDVIACAFHTIGDRWECNEVDVYQERRACEMALRIVYDLRRAQRHPTGDQHATGGTIEGDSYTLPTAMAELVLREVGFVATSLGNSIPFGSMTKAIHETRPRIFWLSVSHIRGDFNFVREFEALSKACDKTGSALVVGGRALNREMRQKMKYASYCDTMQQLETFAKSLLDSHSKIPKNE